MLWFGAVFVLVKVEVGGKKKRRDRLRVRG